jgi:hypothetical protein
LRDIRRKSQLNVDAASKCEHWFSCPNQEVVMRRWRILLAALLYVPLMVVLGTEFATMGRVGWVWKIIAIGLSIPSYFIIRRERKRLRD